MKGNPRKRQVLCPVCSKAFFRTSLPFHTKVCAEQKSGSFESFACPYCFVSVKGNELAAHCVACLKMRACKSTQSEGYRRTIELNDRVENQSFSTKGCQFCKRSFHVDRLVAHERVCKKVTNTPKREQFNSSMRRKNSTEGFSNPLVMSPCKTRSHKKVFTSTLGRKELKPSLHKSRGIANSRFSIGGFAGGMGTLSNRKKMHISNSNIVSDFNPMAPPTNRYATHDGMFYH
jgi:hypothetical protein